MPSGIGLPGIAGKPIAAFVFCTSVPSASVGYLLSGIGVFFVTHSTSRAMSAVRIGAEGAGFVGSAHVAAAFTGFVDVRTRRGRRRATRQGSNSGARFPAAECPSSRSCRRA